MNAIYLPGERNADFEIDLTVSNFDRVAGGLRALLIFSLVAVVGMSIIWLMGFQPNQRHSWAAPLVPASDETIREITLPDVMENVPLPEQASLSAGFPEATDEISLEELLSRVVTAVSNIQAEFEELSTLSIDRKRRHGKEEGHSDVHFPRGIGGIVPTYKRWRFEFSAGSFDEYQRQLKAVGVVIGIVEKADPKITKILMNPDQSEVLLSNREQEASTLRFGHRQPRLETWDRRIAASMDVDSSKAIVFHLIESEMRALLWKLEKAEMEATQRELHEIARTVFEIAEVDGQFQFRVCEQRIR
jgi:hypothetical protein